MALSRNTESFLRNADHADDPNKNQLRHINAFFSLSYFDAKEGFINNESFLSSLGSLQEEEEEWEVASKRMRRKWA